MKQHTASGYLIIKAQRSKFRDSSGVVTALNLPRFVKNRPSLLADEVAVKVNITVPDSVFLEPALEANIELAERDVIQPEVTVEELPKEADEAHTTREDM